MDNNKTVQRTHTIRACLGSIDCFLSKWCQMVTQAESESAKQHTYHSARRSTVCVEWHLTLPLHIKVTVPWTITEHCISELTDLNNPCCQSVKQCIWVRSRNCGCLVTWFCYQLIAKPGNKTAAVSWPDPSIDFQGHPSSHKNRQFWTELGVFGL